jgi:hypothetical protein
MTARARKARPRSPAPQPAAPLLAIVEAPAGATTSTPAAEPAAPRADITFTVEYGMYGANSKPLVGARWRASFYDPIQGQFYAGSADCPFEAIGWAMFEREQRIANKNHPTVTKASNETPLQALARLRGERC